MSDASLNTAALRFLTLVALIHSCLFMSSGSEGRRSAGLNATRGAPMDSEGTSLNKGSCAVTERDDSLLTTETDAVLQVDDSLICLIPPSSWKRSLMGPPKGKRGGGWGVGGARFRMSSRFPEGSKKDLSPQLMLLAYCCGLKYPFYMPFGKGNTCRPLMSLKLRRVGQPESLTYIYWN